MKVSADLSKCVGSGQCVANAPRIFTQDPQTGLVQLLDPSPADSERADAANAADACPVRAIAIRE